jgi:hypothetical protein
MRGNGREPRDFFRTPFRENPNSDVLNDGRRLGSRQKETDSEASRSLVSVPGISVRKKHSVVIGRLGTVVICRSEGAGFLRWALRLPGNLSLLDDAAKPRRPVGVEKDYPECSCREIETGEIHKYELSQPKTTGDFFYVQAS